MSTRCVITVIGGAGTFHIYRHSDGYPDTPYGVIADLQKVIDGDFVWNLPRFEADEFAAGIIATLKNDGGGGYRFSKGPKYHGDLEYVYVVRSYAGGINVTYNEVGSAEKTTVQLK